MTFVCDSRLTIAKAKYRSQAHRRKTLLENIERERCHFDRQHTDTEPLDDLRLVGDDDEAFCLLLDDLLAQQRTAAAFDQP